VIVVASAAVIFGAFVIHANRAWFAREIFRLKDGAR
jgi:hypothetical protein